MKTKLSINLIYLYFILGCSPILKNNNKDPITVSSVNTEIVSRFDYNKKLRLAFHSDKGSLYAVLKDYNKNKQFDLGDTLEISYFNFRSNPQFSTTYKFPAIDKMSKIETCKDGEKPHYVTPNSLEYEKYIGTVRQFLY